MTSPSARWTSVTPPSPASRWCTRFWPSLCYRGPSKDSTPACLLTAKQALGSHTRECFWFELMTVISLLLICSLCENLKYVSVNLIICLKSLFRMMGFGEEEGVIPRFCQELFTRLASMITEEVKSDFFHAIFLNVQRLQFFFRRQKFKQLIIYMNIYFLFT